MGYTRVVQYGEFIEIYNYSKNVHKKKQRRSYKRGTRHKHKKHHYRSSASAQRARKSFFRLAQANLYTNGIPTFVTFTNFEDVSIELGYQYLRFFYKNLKKAYGRIVHLTVPEWTKKNRLHFHALVWGLPQKAVEEERDTRLLQRYWARGYIDVRRAKDASHFIALYMAKYLSKSYTDERLCGRRAYTNSHNIVRPLSAGSNQMSSFLDDIVPETSTVVETKEYDTMFFGTCNYTLKKMQ